MKVVVQRVKKASVTVEHIVTGSIKNGILAYVGFDIDDTNKDIDWIVNKLPKLRIFNDLSNKMNLSVIDKGYDILIISQFTLLGCCKKGMRPSYNRAAKPDVSKIMYEEFLLKLKKSGVHVESGVFQAHMDVEYINDGPVTIIIDSKE